MTKIIRPFEKAGGYTTFENEIIDYIMPICNPNEWKVICATIRKTVGWQKIYDWISISQYMELTGIKGKETCFNAIHQALEHGFIIRKQIGKQSYSYALNKNYELLIPSTGSKSDKAGTEIEPVTDTKSVPTKQIKKRNYRNKISTQEKYTLGEFSDWINPD